MINFDKISKIKNKNDIKKYKIDEPIFLGNYLFHYLILTNNLKALKLVRHPIYKENNEGLQGYHLAAKIYSETKSLKILEYLLKNYPEYSANVNYFNENFLEYIGVSDDLIKLIKKYKNIKWKILLMHEVETEESSKRSILVDIFYEGSYKLIKFILDKFDFDYEELKMIPFFQIPSNVNLKTKEKINILKIIKNKNKLDTLDKNGFNIVFATIEKGDFQILKYLIKNDLDLDKYVPIYTLHPFIFSYEKELIYGKGKNKYRISEYIWNIIKDSHNFRSTNKFGENLAFSVIKNRILNGSGSYKLESEILEKNDVWNSMNVNKKTIVHLLISLPFEKYSKFLNKVPIDKEQKDSNGKTILDYADKKWLTFLKKLPNKKFENGVKLKEYKFANTNSFSSTILDTGLFFTYLDKKYKNLYIPKYLDKVEEDLNWDGGLVLPHPLVEDYNNFAWIIYWEDKYNYLIHKNLNGLINSKKNDENFDCAAVLLSVRLPHGGLHAELIYYDFKNNFIERFDPYGNSYDIDPNLDDVLEEELTWNTGFYYLNVKKYLPVSGFQSMSDELNELKEKPGDFGGYCLAWCLWYLEHRIINNKYTAKKIIPKLLNKILRSKNSLMEYIRNYANDINKHRLDLLKKIGIDKNKLTNLNFSYHEEKKIFNFMINETTIN